MKISISVYVTDIPQIEIMNYYCKERKIFFVPCNEYKSSNKNIVNYLNKKMYDKFIEDLLISYDMREIQIPYVFDITINISEEEMFYISLQGYNS